jgi:hypothetical protein
VAKVLFICPTEPLPTRTGLAMRAAVSLEGLSAQHDVSVAVVRYDERSLAWARDHASAAVHFALDESRHSAISWVHTAHGREVLSAPLPDLVRKRPPAIGGRIAEELGASFDAVLVMRVHLAGVAVPFLDAGVPALLDADDDEVSARRSMVSVDPLQAASAAGYEPFQNVVFPWFDRVLFASLEDAIAPRVHLPNSVEIPTRWACRPRSEPLEVVFVGADGYAPNRDALRRLRERIMPAIAAMGVDARLRHPSLDEDVGPYYERAHIAVVPLRSGGGTRIKILEAFAHGCAVVSTPMGARGLAVRDDEELVVTADDEDDAAFAGAVVSLASDEPRRFRLAGSARGFVAGCHDRRLVGAQLADLVNEVSARRSRSSLGR